MKIMLLKDVYNLGRAGDVKKVANGYARNFLIPQKMAVPATVGATANIERIKAAAAKQRELVNEEMSGLAAQIAGLELVFKAKVGEAGKLFGSITQQMIAEAISEKIGAKVDRHWVESQPLREAGDHEIKVRLTFDLIPEVKVTIVSDVEEEKEEEPEGKRKHSRKAEAKSEAAEGTEASFIEESVEIVETTVAGESIEIVEDSIIVEEAAAADETETPSAEEPPSQKETSEE